MALIFASSTSTCTWFASLSSFESLSTLIVGYQSGSFLHLRERCSAGPGWGSAANPNHIQHENDGNLVWRRKCNGPNGWWHSEISGVFTICRFIVCSRANACRRSRPDTGPEDGRQSMTIQATPVSVRLVRIPTFYFRETKCSSPKRVNPNE